MKPQANFLRSWLYTLEIASVAIGSISTPSPWNLCVSCRWRRKERWRRCDCCTRIFDIFKTEIALLLYTRSRAMLVVAWGEFFKSYTRHTITPIHFWDEKCDWNIENELLQFSAVNSLEVRHATSDRWNTTYSNEFQHAKCMFSSLIMIVYTILFSLTCERAHTSCDAVAV